MIELRKFRWPGGECGYDVIDGAVYYVNKHGIRSNTADYTTVKDLERWAKSSIDPLEEVEARNPRVRKHVVTQETLLFDGNVVTRKELEDLRADIDAALK